MHISLSRLLSLTTLLTSTLAQTNTSTTDYSVNCLKFPPTIIGNATFNPDAITGLSNALAKNTYNPPLPSDGIKLSPGGASRVGYQGAGGYQVCLQNFYLFKSVTVKLEDVSAVVTQIGQKCCGDTPNAPGQPGRQGKCQDAKATMQSTDGSNVKVVGQDYGDRCCGMFMC